MGLHLKILMSPWSPIALVRIAKLAFLPIDLPHMYVVLIQNVKCCFPFGEINFDDYSLRRKCNAISLVYDDCHMFTLGHNWV